MSSVGQALGGVVGAVIGFFAGGPQGALYGAQIGMMAGGYLDPPKGPHIEGPRLSDLTVQTSTYGAVIPRVYGTVAITGNVFWLENNRLKETVTTTKNKAGGKGGGKKSTTTTYSYSATFAVGLCEGDITGVRRIWVGSNLIYDAGSDDMETIRASNANAASFSLYTGSETQSPDARMQASLGVANTPAYRGLAYLVFNDFALANYGNSLMGAPVKVEVVKSGSVAAVGSEHAMPFSYSDPFEDIVWIEDRFIATQNTWHVDVSADGKTWAEVDTGIPPFTYRLKRIAWDGSIAVATVFGEAVCYTTRTGYDWAQVALPVSANWVDITHNGAQFFLVSQGDRKVCTSPDGHGWTLRKSSLGLDAVLPFSNAARVVANGSLVLCLSSSTDAATTTDGAGWTSVTLPGLPTGGSGGWLGCCEYSGLFVITGGAAGCQTSPDGATWTPRAIPSAPLGQWSACCVAGEALVVSSGNYVAYTYDLASWTLALVSDLPEIWHTELGVAWNGAYAVTVGSVTHHRSGVVRLDRIGSAMPLLGAIVASECIASGLLQSADLDTAEIGDSVRGYRVGSIGAIRGALEPLQGAFPFDVVQSGYGIKFRRRGGSTVAAIPAADLDARGAGDKPGVSLTLVREMDSQLPARVSVQHLDVGREYNPGEQYADRLITESVNIRAIDLPIVLTPDEAAGVAEALLDLYWLERYDASFNLPPIYNHLEPADIVAVASAYGSYEFRLTGINYTADGRLECRAKYNASALYTPTAIGEAGGAAGGEVSYSGPTVLELLDLPSLGDDQDTPGFAVATCGRSVGWPGCAVYRSDDGGESFSNIATGYPPGATIGSTLTALGSHPGVFMDATGSLTVRLYSGALESVSLATLYAGANHFAYGADGRWEILAARDAVDNGDGTWTFKTFIRGRFGSEWATGLHQVGDRLVELDSGLVEFLGVGSSTIGLERIYRAPTVGAAADSGSLVSFAYRAVNLKPLSPINLNGDRHPVSNDWTILWTRRSRLGGAWRDLVDAPLGETTESYEIEIWDSGYSALKRTLVASTPTAAYTSAQQISDFGGNQSTLYVRIYQLSAAVGRGYAMQSSITR